MMIIGRFHNGFGSLRGSRAWLALGLPFALAACDIGPDYQHPDLPAPAAWHNPPEAAAPVWPATEWWHGFGSTQLDSYIAAAQAANNDLAAAVARVREADAQAKIAGAPLLPSLSLGATATHERAKQPLVGAETFNEYSPLLNASYEIDFWGKNAAALNAAEETALASRYDQATVALTMETSVATTYFQSIELRDRLEVAQNNLDSATTILKGLQLEEQVGTVTALDVAQQETTVATINATIPPLRQQLGQAIDALSILLGQNPETVDPGPAKLSDLTRPALQPGLPSELLQRRPDVANAEAQLISANANIKVARAALFPSIDLTASGGFANTALSSLFNPSNSIFTLTAGLTQPIFEGGALEGQVEYSKARYDELLADYRKAVISAFSNVEDALVGVQQSDDAERRQQDAVTTAQRAFDIAQTQMRAGTTSILNVLNTEAALFTAQDQLVQSKYNHLQALVSLFGALGGGWQKA